MMYHQITAAERYTLMVLHGQAHSALAIARAVGRHRSFISREMHRTRTRHDGYDRPRLADWYARGRRSRSRRNQRFTASDRTRVHRLPGEDWSPEQIAGWLQRHRILAISHQTIYRHVWVDRAAGAALYGISAWRSGIASPEPSGSRRRPRTRGW
jgi:transposase, IS30 family